MSYKRALERFIGLGDAHYGGVQWLRERLGALVMIPLTIGAVWIIVPLFGQSHDVVINALSQPIAALILVGFLLICSHHLAAGLQAVIEDYVHTKGWLIALLLLSKLGSWALGLIGVFAVMKISLGG